MKKIYSLLLAAAVTVTATAGIRNFEIQESSKTYPALSAVKTELNAAALKAPAKAGATAPQSLEGKSASMSFTILEQGQSFAIATMVTFTGEEESEGLKFYNMNNFLDGCYPPELVTFSDLFVAYDPATGTLILPGEQTFATYDGNDYTLWAGESGDYALLDYTFTYTDGTFVFDNPMLVQWEGEPEPSEFFIDTFLIARLKSETQISSIISLDADMSFLMVDALGQMSYIMTTDDEAQQLNDEVGLNVAGSTATILNFAGLGDNVPMTIDTQAKTLTATDVQITAISKYKAYLSESDADGYNAAGDGNYILKSTYTVADGVTTINVPDWNAFFLSFGEDQAYFWPFSETTIVFNLDLDKVAGDAGIGNITTDAVDAAAPVEYFNLQGIRVANPEAGQLLIKRQGKNAEKVLFR